MNTHRGFCNVGIGIVINGEHLIMAQSENFVVRQKASVSDRGSVVEDLRQGIILVSDCGVIKIGESICTA